MNGTSITGFVEHWEVLTERKKKDSGKTSAPHSWSIRGCGAVPVPPTSDTSPGCAFMLGGGTSLTGWPHAHDAGISGHIEEVTHTHASFL